MPYSAMRLIACLAFLLTYCGAFSQEFKGVLYKAPAGWEQGVEAEAKVLAPKGLKQGEVLVIIMTGAIPSNGSSWEKQFTDTIAIANDKGKTSQASEVQTRDTGTTKLLVQTVQLDLAPMGKHSRLYAQVSQGDQRVFVTVVINKNSLMEKYGSAVSDFLANLSFKSAPGAVANPIITPSTGKIPTGDTPDLFPGAVGWRPSGKGVPIPAPAIVNGKPVGLWWKATTDGMLKKVTHVYLADGTRASNPRLGGGRLFDLAGQRAQKGVTGVGTFAIAGGQIVERYDSFETKAAYVTGSDGSGTFFKIGRAMFRPLIQVTEKSIVGKWQGPASTYVFQPDGTYQSAATMGDPDIAVGSVQSGRYVLDGYLIMLQPKDGPLEINRIGFAGPMLAKGSIFYYRR